MKKGNYRMLVRNLRKVKDSENIMKKPFTEQEEEQREAMYNAWRNSKKIVEIDVKKLCKNKGWVGTCKTEFGFVKYGDTRIQVIDRMRMELYKRGYEVGNLPEVMGIG